MDAGIVKYERKAKYFDEISSSKHDKNLKKAQSGTKKKYWLPIINKCYSLLNVITLTTFFISFDKFESFFVWMGENL